jgi:hypothetical protein
MCTIGQSMTLTDAALIAVLSLQTLADRIVAS